MVQCLPHPLSKMRTCTPPSCHRAVRQFCQHPTPNLNYRPAPRPLRHHVANAASTEYAGASLPEANWVDNTLTWHRPKNVPRVQAPANAPPLIILPGFGNNSTDYTAPFGQASASIVSHLEARGFKVYVVPVERKDWFQVARALLTLGFWSSSLTTHPGYTWYLERVAATVEKCIAETGATQADLIGHSAGGWLARAFIADTKYFPNPGSDTNNGASTNGAGSSADSNGTADSIAAAGPAFVVAGLLQRFTSGLPPMFRALLSSSSAEATATASAQQGHALSAEDMAVAREAVGEVAMEAEASSTAALASADLPEGVGPAAAAEAEVVAGAAAAAAAAAVASGSGSGMGRAGSGAATAQPRPNPRIRSIITLGTPQRPPAAGKGRDMTGGALSWVHSTYPGAYFADQSVRYISVAGRAVRGIRSAEPKPRSEQRTPPEYAHDSYTQVCGAGQGVEGDVVVPLSCSFLEGSQQLLLDGVYHSMSRVGTFNDESGVVWYGSDSVIDCWLQAVVSDKVVQGDGVHVALAAQPVQEPVVA